MYESTMERRNGCTDTLFILYKISYLLKAMGDAAMNEENPLPQVGQVARLQGIYLAKVLNNEQKEDEKPFQFLNLGSMASLGAMKGIYDGSKIGIKGSEIDAPKSAGFLAFVSAEVCDKLVLNQLLNLSQVCVLFFFSQQNLFYSFCGDLPTLEGRLVLKIN